MGIPVDCKRLIEVDFPIVDVSRHSAREKSIRQGHPGTLHLWWARRPLAACRAVLLALLLPDPCDARCSEEFTQRAKKVLAWLTEPVKTNEELRKALLKFISDFSNWDFAFDETFIKTARSLLSAAHGEDPPFAVDPFAGGGSIPLEALRLGCDVFASDLNPIACYILKIMLQDLPRQGPPFFKELKHIGSKTLEIATSELSQLYPPDLDDSTPIAYLWARTVRCEAPNCGAEIPLVRSFWLCKKAKRRRAIRYTIERRAGLIPRIDLDIFQPKEISEVSRGTVRRARATCPSCKALLPPDRVRAQLREQRGGADVIFDKEHRRVGGARLLAVVVLRQAQKGRAYRLPTNRDYDAIWKAEETLKKISASNAEDLLSIVPDESLPPHGTLGFRVQLYGMSRWGDLFTSRQKLALVELVRAIGIIWRSNNPATRNVAEILGSTIGKRADYGSSLTKWHLTFEKTTDTFGRQALPMTWDFVEPSPLGDTSGSFGAGLNAVLAACETVTKGIYGPGEIQLADACKSPLPDHTCSVWFTDPPYYDAVPYADLSDFFFVWLKRAMPGHPLLHDPFDSKNALTPKREEIVQDEVKMVDGQPKDRVFFQSKMAEAFSEGRRILRDDGIGCVVFAHKTTEGWEALLSGIITGGWVITASWPIATERPERLRSQQSAALATSVHLVCRPRLSDATVGDWAEVLRELPPRVGTWMDRLQAEGVRGADLIFASIGPALEIFSRHSKVETAEGREVGLPEFLEKVWEVVGKAALSQVLGAGGGQILDDAALALEEDARLTALFLWTLQTTDGRTIENSGPPQEDEDEEMSDDAGEDGSGRRKKKGYRLVYDIVRRFAQPLGIHLDAWEGKIIEIEKGSVRLLPLEEREKYLFGAQAIEDAVGNILEPTNRGIQLKLVPETEAHHGGKREPGASGEARKITQVTGEQTTLDLVHTAMMLQSAGQTVALREFLAEEMGRGPRFLRLANALSALYPKDGEEKRLLDAVLLASRSS